MVIYTLPGPTYDYSTKLVKFQPDVIELEATLNGSAKSFSDPEGGTAHVTLHVHSVKGLSDVTLSLTPSDSQLGAAVVTPSDPRSGDGIVGGSFVVHRDYLEPGSQLSISLKFRRNSTEPADLTALLTADELLDAVSANVPI